MSGVVDYAVPAALVGGLLQYRRREMFAGMLAHPLVVAPAVGLVLRDAGIGTICGVALSTLWERDRDRDEDGATAVYGGIAAAAGTAAAVYMSDRGGMGGLVVEGFFGALLGLLAAAAAIPVERWTRARAPALRALALGVLLLLATALLALGGQAARQNWPQLVRGLVPWVSGALLVLGIGGAIGRVHPRSYDALPGSAVPRVPDGAPAHANETLRHPASLCWEELRVLAVVAGLLVVNVLGLPGMWVLLLGFAWLEWGARLLGWAGPRAAARDSFPWRSAAIAARGAMLLLAIPVSLFIAWIPWQLPSQEGSSFPFAAPWAIPVGIVGHALLVPGLLIIGILGAQRLWPLPPVVGLGLAWSAAVLSLGW